MYALCLVLIPVSFGVKEILNLHYWLDPTLILALLIFLLWPQKPRPLVSAIIPVAAIVSAYAGTFYMPPVYGDFLTLYHIFKEPLRLFLVLFFFWISVRFFIQDRKFALQWISISVIIQLGLALYLICAVLGKLPYPDFLEKYIEAHLQAQWAYIGSFDVPRLCGTFYESPPLGMFMVACLVILAFGRLRDGVRDKLVAWGLAAAAIGTAWSLSEQVLLGLLPLCAALILTSRRGKGVIRLGLVALLLLMIPFVSTKLMHKIQEEQEVSGQAVVGTSGGERAYHVRYALRTLQENPWAWLTGFGPGRYGEYASRTGIFPDTVTPQVTPIAWLFGFGVLGTFVIAAWLLSIAKSAVNSYGILIGLGVFFGILFANMFQAGWKNESFFLAMAYLYASSHFKRPPTRQQKKRELAFDRKRELASAQRIGCQSLNLIDGEIP